VNEREMQELLWKYPKELLKEELTPFRWEMAGDVGRADLVFEDRHSNLLIVEVKHGRLPRGAISQLVDYFGIVKREFPDRAVELMAIANDIPRERKQACDRYDIEPREIAEVTFRKVAAAKNYFFSSDRKTHTLAGERQLPDPHSKQSELSANQTGGHTNQTDLNSFPRIVQELAQAAMKLQPNYGKSIPRVELKKEVHKYGHYKLSSIMPSDYCYDRKNASEVSNKWRIFLDHGRYGLYEYVGPNYSYTGPVRSRTRAAKSI
jgi:hypothetical protein